MKRLLITLLLLTSPCWAQEKIVDFSADSLPVLNEELRKLQDATEILKKAYPVGSIYISTVSTNPGTLFGFGTWEAFGAGRVLVGYDSTDADFDESEETGGAKTHTLTAAEIPAHTHNYYKATDGVGGETSPAGSGTGNVLTATSSYGSGEAHSIVQPYIVVYLFERTA